MPTQRFDQALFSEFFSGIIERFGNAVGVKSERVAGEKLEFGNRAVPYREDSQYCARGIQPFQRAVAPQQKTGEVPAIGVTQTPQLVVIFREEEGGVGALGRILVKELVRSSATCQLRLKRRVYR